MAKKDYRSQLVLANEELLRLRLELIQAKDMAEDKIKQARVDERVRVARELLAERGGE